MGGFYMFASNLAIFWRMDLENVIRGVILLNLCDFEN